LRDSWSLIAQTSGSKIYWVLATLLTSVITARFLGPVARGVLVAALAWVTMFATFGYLSLGQVIIHVAAAKERREWLTSFLGSLVAILALMAVIGWVIAAVLYVATGGQAFHHLDPLLLLLAFAGLPFLLWIENGNGALMALGKLPVMNLAQTIGATATVVLTFLAVGPLRLDVYGALLALLIAQALTVAISLGYLLQRAGRLRFEAEPARELFKGGIKLHLNAVGTFLFSHANVLILNHFRSTSETAYFQLAAQLTAGLQIIPLAVSAVTYSLVSQEGPNAAWPRQRRLLFQTVGLIIVVGAVAYFAAPLLIPLVFGAAFAPAVPVFRVLLLGLVGMTVSIVMASQWISRGLFLQAAVLTLAIGLTTVIANWIVIPRHGMFGAAWVTVSTYVAALIANLVMAFWVENRSHTTTTAS